MAKKMGKIPVMATIGAGAYGYNIVKGFRESQMDGAMWYAFGMGNDGKINWGQFVKNVAPVAAGIGGSMLASKLGANRYISQIPFLKL